MIIPQFLRFYGGYTVDTVLSEYGKRFFSLVNSMFRIQSVEIINNATAVSIAMAESKDKSEALHKLDKNAQGIHGILQEVRVVKRNKRG